MSNAPAWIHPLSFSVLAALVVACAPVQAPPAATETPPVPNKAVTGWYVQDATRATLQPCGVPEYLTVVDGGELRKRANDFGLQDDLPVYVRVHGSRSGGEFRLARVDQFGSAVPIRDCPMTGTTIQQ